MLSACIRVIRGLVTDTREAVIFVMRLCLRVCGHGGTAPRAMADFALSRPYLAKSTFGTACASGGASNSLYSSNPNTFAVTLAGNWRRAVL